jgi:hypothetical protein
MKKPFDGIIIKVKPKTKESRQVARLLTCKMNTPEMKEKIHNSIMDKMFQFGKQKVG